jgi:hypothetical protein
MSVGSTPVTELPLERIKAAPLRSAAGMAPAPPLSLEGPRGARRALGARLRQINRIIGHAGPDGCFRPVFPRSVPGSSRAALSRVLHGAYAHSGHRVALDLAPWD